MPRLLLFVLLTILSASAVAQPSSATRWLMSEPMSLFDWGIYRLETRLASLGRASPSAPAYLHGFAAYDRRANRIRVGVTLVGIGTESECIESLRRVKRVIVPLGMSDEERNKAAPAVLAEVFSHVGGYGSREVPDNLGEELASMVSIEVGINRKEAVFSLKPAVFCTGNFTSTAISVGGQ